MQLNIKNITKGFYLSNVFFSTKLKRKIMIKRSIYVGKPSYIHTHVQQLEIKNVNTQRPAALRSASFESRHFDSKPKIIQIPNLR